MLRVEPTALPDRKRSRASDEDELYGPLVRPTEAIREYLRGQGCRNEEIVRLRSDALAWRGAVFTATPAPSDPPAA